MSFMTCLMKEAWASSPPTARLFCRLPAGLTAVFLVLSFASCNRTQDGKPLRLSSPLPSVQSNQLRAVADFAVFPDQKERSRALFLEASRVLLHPRCANCHPDGDVPAQGMAMIPHQPPVTRGTDGHGVVGMECAGCHQDSNVNLARVPARRTGTSRRLRWRGSARRPPRLRAAEGPQAQRRQEPRGDRGHSAARRARCVGMGAGAWARARAGNTGAVQGAHGRVGEEGAACPKEEVRR